MLQCRIIENKLFGTNSYTGKYLLENGIIFVSYQAKCATKTFTFTLAELQVEHTRYDKTLLSHPRKRVKFVVEPIAVVKHKENENELSKYFKDAELVLGQTGSRTPKTKSVEIPVQLTPRTEKPALKTDINFNENTFE
ncbi:Hypothetical_protein [Hexamita inflata]|uniref:Hypothetical_protein n=1 Tax=Hexamita inflata TaxID=28002 RepID=A0AA86UE69_9EUKA|nr:Hypothetical protein HINF_LOCUS39839 [Hexamita inflata]